jgi:hypothetical protein
VVDQQPCKNLQVCSLFAEYKPTPAPESDSWRQISIMLTDLWGGGGFLDGKNQRTIRADYQRLTRVEIDRSGPACVSAALFQTLSSDVQNCLAC